MRVLLDTPVLLWFLEDSAKLGPKVRRLLARPDTDLVISDVSLLKLAFLSRAGRMHFKDGFNAWIWLEVVPYGWQRLHLHLDHMLVLSGLSPASLDPFDLLLAAQALHEELPLITANSVFASLGVKTFWSA